MVDWNSPHTLREAIASTGMTIPDFAARAGVSKAQLFRLIAGEFQPRFQTQSKIEAALSGAAISTSEGIAA